MEQDHEDSARKSFLILLKSLTIVEVKEKMFGIYLPDFDLNIVGKGLISNLGEHRESLHPDLYSLLLSIHKKDAPGIDYSYLENFKQEDGSVFRIVTSYRSGQDQVEQLDQGNTNAKPFRSYHQWGLAVDIIPRATGYEDLGRILERSGVADYLKVQGAEWGGDWQTLRDYAHFQLSYEVPINTLFSGRQWWLYSWFLNQEPISYYDDRKTFDGEGGFDIFPNLDRMFKVLDWVVIGLVIIGGGFLLDLLLTDNMKRKILGVIGLV